MSLIYCVEDDTNIRELIEYTLQSAGFETVGFENGKYFFDKISKIIPDLILLDIMLPDMDGLEIMESLKNNDKTKNIPIIILTAKSDRMDKIKGLDSGADDYITKPFDVLELISRIKAVLRRSINITKDSQIINYHSICLDNSKHMVTVNGDVVSLTYKEYELLRCLLSANGDVVTRGQLIANVWGTNFEGESRTLDVHVRTLRQKLGECENYIETVRNVGYRMIK